jgi:hypothetical protein
MYQQTFWVAVTAAAPVVALAAIVAFSDSTANASRMRQFQVDRPLWTFPDEKRDLAQAKARTAAKLGGLVALLCVCNTILQAAVLAFSLTGLASHVDEMPPVVAIAAEVAGIAALAGGAVVAATCRSWVDDMMALSIQVPDTSQRRQGD